MSRINTNLRRLREEWALFKADQAYNLARLKNGNWNPNDRDHFYPHVIAAFVSTFFGLRRTLTYLTLIGLPVGLVYWIICFI